MCVDAWNSVYPLLSLFHRPQLAVTWQGWLTAYSEGGWLPKWASPGYRGSMVGTMGDVSLAAAIVNRIPGFDARKAYEAIRKDAFEIPPGDSDGSVGRVCLQAYLKFGYIPRDAPMIPRGNCYEVVSRTLNYLQSDYAISRAAETLGLKDDALVLQRRVNASIGLLFDNKTGFFRSRELHSGKFTQPFDQFAWGGDYTEGGPWQYRFYLPFDVDKLESLYRASGRDFCSMLKSALTMNHSTFHIGGYSEEIHEQTELADRCWGQYAHNNQPVHHMLYMHMFGGYRSTCATQGRAFIRRTLLELYTAGNDMFPGDEDNGEMSAWYVLSAMGLYERSPGSGMFELGIPLFSRVEVDISDSHHDQKLLIIEAVNSSVDNVYVNSIKWNGQQLGIHRNSIRYSLLAEGGVLTFEMAPSPY